MATLKTLRAVDGIQFQKNTSSSRMTLTAPSSLTPYTFTLPNGPGSNGNYLASNGSGGTSWSAPSINSADDSVFYVYNQADNTKHMQFSVANVAGSTTRTVSMPNRNIDLGSNNNTGFQSWSGSGNYYSLSGSTFSLLRGGTGYINGTLITFAAQGPITIDTNSTSYVCIDSTGTLGFIAWGSITINSYQNNIFLFEILYDGTVSMVKNEQHPWTFQQNISSFFHNNLGPIIRGAGAVLSIGTVTTQLQINSDTYEDHGLSMNIPAANPITWQMWYQNASGFWIRHSTGTTLTAFWNNAGTATAVSTNGNYVVYRTYVTNGFAADGTQAPIYIMVLNTALYTTLTNANNAINAGTISAPTNELYAVEPAQLGYVVVRWQTGGVITISQITIQKNTFNSRYVGGAASSSHLLLGDLAGGTYGDGGHTNLVQLATSTSAPTVNADIDSYKLGTVWVKTDDNTVYLCQNNTDGAAVWFCLNRPRVAAFRWVPRTITAASTTLDDTYGLVLCDCTSNNVGITLPALASYSGIVYRIAKTDAGTNTVTITPNGSEKIDGLSSITLTTQSSIELTNCGTQWMS